LAFDIQSICSEYGSKHDLRQKSISTEYGLEKGGVESDEIEQIRVVTLRLSLHSLKMIANYDLSQLNKILYDARHEGKLC
jgi:hypothetical protein